MGSLLIKKGIDVQDSPATVDILTQPLLTQTGVKTMLAPRTIFQLNAVSCCDSNYNSNHNLDGINFHRSPDGSPMAVATDRRRLMAATWEEDDPQDYPAIAGCDPSKNGSAFQATIPSKICKKAPTLAKDGVRSRQSIIARNIAIDEHTPEDKIRKDGTSERVSLGATDLENGETLDVATQEGRFPRYHEVFTDTSKAITVKLDVVLLESILTTFRKMGVENVVLGVVDHNTAVTLTGQTEDKRESVAGVINPIVKSCGKAPVIGWVPSE